MPQNFMSKVFTAKLFPRNARWKFGNPLPAHRSRVVWLFSGRTVAVLLVLCAIRTFRSAYLDVYLKRPSNELPQPSEVPGVPASTVLAVNHSVESTVVKRRYSTVQPLQLPKLNIGRYAVVHAPQQLLESTVKL